MKILIRKLHTHIHNSSLQPFSQDYGLAFHTTYVECANSIQQWRELQFNVDFKRQILEKLFHGRFIYSQSFCQKSAERKLPNKIFFFYFFCNLYLTRGLGLETGLDV